MTAFIDTVISRAERSYAASRWRSLYQQAMVETDPGHIYSRIEQAEAAIIERSRELARLGQVDDEDTELTSAILALCDLRRKMQRGAPAA